MEKSNFWLEVLKILIPALFSILIIFIARNIEKRKEIENKIRDKKIEIYEEFCSKVVTFLLNYPKVTKQKQEKLQNEMKKSFEDVHKNLLFWGSDEIIRKYNQFYLKLTKFKANLKDLEILFFELRKDTGLKNKKLQQGDLLKLLLNADSLDENGNIIGFDEL